MGAELAVDVDPVELVGREQLAAGDVHERPRHLRRASHRTPRRVMIGTTVGDVNDVGQHPRQTVDVTFEDRRQKRIRQLTHLGGRRSQPGTPVANLVAGSTRHLPCRCLVAIDRHRDIGERNGEHVVEEEHCPLRRIQCFEHPQESEGE